MKNYHLVSVLILGLIPCWGLQAQVAELGIMSEKPEFLGRSVGYWADRLASKDRKDRRLAISQLIEGKKAAVPLTAYLLKSGREKVRKEATAILSRIGKDSVPYLILRLKDTNANTRYEAVSALRNLGSEGRQAIPRLARLLRDDDPYVSMEAGRALAMMKEHAFSAVKDLSRALHSRYPLTRAMAAGALGAIGPKAHEATKDLITALEDDDSVVRRCAAEAIASIGPQARASIPQLIKALWDSDRHVRICAIGALGRMGEHAQEAIPILNKARQYPAFTTEASWALSQITKQKVEPLKTSIHFDSTVDSKPVKPKPGSTVRVERKKESGLPAMLGKTPYRNNVFEGGVNVDWIKEGRKSLRWTRRLGDETYGCPIVSGGKVFVGTSNENPRNRKVKGRRGVLMAFKEDDGTFLWQDSSPLRRNSLQKLLLPVTSSSPLVEGDRLFYIDGQGQLRCLDTEGFYDDENDGEIKNEPFKSNLAADLIWQLDLVSQLGVFVHEAANCSVTSVGDLLMVCTSNGVDESHTNIPAPRAPSFIGVHKKNGRVAWQIVGPSPNVMHGQWSSPSVAKVKGRDLAFFGGGDGWLYALEASTGREIWRFNGNPKDAVWHTSGDIRGLQLKNNIIACPVFYDGKVYLSMGQDPTHGQGQGALFAIDPKGSGDVTGRRQIWVNRNVGRIVATPVIQNNLLFAADYNGIVHCIDAQTGKHYWEHDVLAGVWGGLVLAGDQLYVADEDGVVNIFEAKKEKKHLTYFDLDAPIWSVPTVHQGCLYITSANSLFVIGKKK